jgi:transcriptional regulator with XRE-family HTH domain
MEGFGARLAARARELGLSNAEVARRAGLSERRFGNYATDTREPDLQTLAVLARLLWISSDELLGVTAPKEGQEARDELIGRINASLGTLDESDLETLAVQVRAVAQHRQK